MTVGKTDTMLRAVVDAAQAGARVVAISNKRTAARTHAALKRMNVGERDGDAWIVGNGTIEVRT